MDTGANMRGDSVRGAVRPIRVVCWSLDETRVCVCHGYVGGTPLEEWLPVCSVGDESFVVVGGVRHLVGACDLIPCPVA